jgi:hypothetical protein
MWTEEYQVEYMRRYLHVAAQRSFMAGMHVSELRRLQNRPRHQPRRRN